MYKETIKTVRIYDADGNLISMDEERKLEKEEDPICRSSFKSIMEAYLDSLIGGEEF